MDVAADAVELDDIDGPQILAHLDDELGLSAQLSDQVDSLHPGRAKEGIPLSGPLLEHADALASDLTELCQEGGVSVLYALFGEETLPLILVGLFFFLAGTLVANLVVVAVIVIFLLGLIDLSGT
jgi:hypothetical protein